ncbi:hypothetical protein BaRGS_00024944 [Batillaria attramentaria]|uniref:Uncharacterized protein n=1 Tax=Batillaria attramentaria TaxID=370345 RepID=A0ABD0K9N0_9CAEN
MSSKLSLRLEVESKGGGTVILPVRIFLCPASDSSEKQSVKKPKGIAKDSRSTGELDISGEGDPITSTDKREELGVDTATVHETILTRVNEAFRQIYEDNAGESGGISVKQIIAAIMTAVAASVSEITGKMLGVRG